MEEKYSKNLLIKCLNLQDQLILQKLREREICGIQSHLLQDYTFFEIREEGAKEPAKKKDLNLLEKDFV